MLELRACTVDLGRGRAVRGGGEVVSLTTREVDLLRYLAARPAATVSRDELLQQVWGYSDAVLTRACDNMVRRLRTKIEADPANPDHVITVHGQGYRFEPATVEVSAPAPDAPPPARRVLQLGEVAVDLGRQVAAGPAGETALTAQEVALLEHLAQAGGAVIDRATLLRRIWGASRGRPLESAIHRLRTKIEPDPSAPRYLLTARGGGYRLETGSARADVRPEGPRDDGFVGRTRDLAALRRAVSAPGSWTVLTGPGGMGKTQLARRAAATFSGPVCWVDALPATDLAGLCSAVAAALDVQAPDEDAVDRIGAHLARRGRVLLVLDNLEQCLEAVAAAVGPWRAAAPELAVLGTSRLRPDLDGEVAIELGPLEPDDAVELFVRRAHAASRSFTAPADPGSLRRLVDALDRIPLAVELAAARVSVLSVEQLLERMDRQLDLLARPRAAVERHRSLRAALQDSWDQLTPPERQALQVLALFRAGFEATDADGLLGADGVDVLQALRDRSWVHTLRSEQELLLGVYEPIRAFVAELRAAREDGGRAPELAWARWMSRLGDPDHLGVVHLAPNRRLAEAHRRSVDDLEAAARTSLRWGEGEAAAGCAAGAAAIRVRRGPFGPVLALVEETVALPNVPERLSAWLHLHYGRLLRATDQPAEAEKPFRRAAELAWQVGDPQCEGIAWQSVAICRADLQDREGMVAAMARAVEAHASGGRPDLEAYCRARVEMGLHRDEEEARRQLEVAIRGAVRCGDRTLAGLARRLLGDLDVAAQRSRLALRWYLESADDHRADGFHELEIFALTRLMLSCLDLGLHDEIERAGARALECLVFTGSVVDEALVRAYIGASRTFRGRPEDGVEQLQRARQVLQGARPVPRTAGYIDLREAQARLALGEAALALALAERSEQALATAGDEHWPVAVQAACHLEAGDVERARSCAERAVQGFRARGQRAGLAQALAQRGLVALRAGDPGAAAADLAEATALARALELGAPGTCAGQLLDALRTGVDDSRGEAP